MRAAARRPTKGAWLAAAKIAVSIVLLVIVSRSIDLDGVASILAQIPASTVAAAVTLIAIQTCVQGLRWWLVTSALAVPMRFARAVRLTFVGVFFNQVLPTSVGGDAVRIWHVHRGGVGIQMAIKSVFLERVCGVLGLCVLVPIGLMYLGDRIGNPSLRLGLMAVLPLGLLAVAVLASFDLIPSGFRQWRPLGELARLGADARRLFLAPAAIVPVILLSMVGHTLSAQVVYVLAAGLHLDLSVWDCLAIVPSVLLATLIPISFAGWGLREGAMIVMLGYLGTGADTALAVSLVFGVVLILAALPGCLFWLLWREPRGAGART